METLKQSKRPTYEPAIIYKLIHKTIAYSKTKTVLSLFLQLRSVPCMMLPLEDTT